jgi:hypothetical protein
MLHLDTLCSFLSRPRVGHNLSAADKVPLFLLVANVFDEAGLGRLDREDGEGSEVGGGRERGVLVAAKAPVERRVSQNSFVLIFIKTIKTISVII